MSNRDEYIKGLRTVADLLEANPDLPGPYHGSGWVEELIFVRGDNAMAQALIYIEAMNEPPQVWFEKGTNNDLRIKGSIGGYIVELCLTASEMCEPVTVETIEWKVPAALTDAVEEKAAAFDD